MANDGETRRLAAIFMTDIVAYSWLMAADECGTLVALKALRKELRYPKIEEYRGRLVKLMGGGQLVEFSSVVAAVECAVDVQRAMARRNAEISEDPQNLRADIGRVAKLSVAKLGNWELSLRA